MPKRTDTVQLVSDLGQEERGEVSETEHIVKLFLRHMRAQVRADEDADNIRTIISMQLLLQRV